MNKALVYTRNGALIVGLGNGLINIMKQLNNQPNFSTVFDWGQLLLAISKGAVVGATGGFIFGSIEDKRMSKILNTFKGSVPKYLNETLDYYQEDDGADFILYKANQIRLKLHNKFKQDLIKYPNYNGSFAKGTSIQGSDKDIQLRFKKHTGTLEQIFNKVHAYLNNELNDSNVVNIRKQRHSIGIAYQLNEEIIRIDVIPARFSENRYNDDYIYVSNTSLFGQSTFKKINSDKQLKSLNFSTQEKKIIKLLKVWKNENEVNIKSIYLELLVKKAFTYGRISRNINRSLLDVLNYIAENIHLLRVVDPANTNNIISETLTYHEKISLSNYCFDMIDKIIKDKRNIIDYFPIN
jgi:hypothetical protein